ncbi:chromate efflux transporter [Desulfatirhabdium butyrativorans]|uniref:chromate efflux transporter n=1 Tax=Desulfatirhabdium butyrativorans TaxID=340467 RepID=UPI0004257AA6|nr:chromate efflux transporter [Desulfatirhabdium butyrativorans]
MPTETSEPIMDRPSLQALFGAFLGLGLTAFGGPAMIAYLRKMAVEKHPWLDRRTFQDGVALCQMIPGATVMQMAAYIGLHLRGMAGAAIAYIGFGLPAFFLMLALSMLYGISHELPAVVSAFSGLQAVIVAIVANATLSFGKTTLRNRKSLLLGAAAAGLFWIQANPVLILLVAALSGVLLYGPSEIKSKISGHTPPAKAPSHSFWLLLIGSITGFALLFVIDRRIFDLAFLMSKIDLIAFGGGFASVPLLFHEIVQIRGWMDGQTFLNGIVLGQFTPGPIVITATFVGYLVQGIPGALVATAAVFLPSFLILIGVSPHFTRLRATPWFSRVIQGILCSFVGLLITVTIRFGLNVHWNLSHTALAAASFAALRLDVDILWVVITAAFISVLIL